MQANIKERINRKKHIFMIGMMALLLLLILPTVSVKAEPVEPVEPVTVGDFIITGGTLGTDYSYSAYSVLEVKTGTPIDIKNVDVNEPTGSTISVKSGITANITLSGVNIKTQPNTFTCPFVVEDYATLNLTLAKDTANTLTGRSQFYPALQVKTSASITIGGEGTLTAYSDFTGAGIGGMEDEKNGEITINNGTIIARSRLGAAIGSGGHSTSDGTGTNGKITINGGTIYAYTLYGAGIGSGCYSAGTSPGPIVINGGNIYTRGFSGIGKGDKGQGTKPLTSGKLSISSGANIIAVAEEGTLGAINTTWEVSSTANILEVDFSSRLTGELR